MRVDDPAVAIAFDAGFPSVLLDESSVSFGSARGVQVIGAVPVRTAAPDAGRASAARAADGKNGMTVDDEVRHRNLLGLETGAG